MSHLLQPLKSPYLRRWACFKKHRAFPNALRFSKRCPPCSFRLLSCFAMIVMNGPGLIWANSERDAALECA
jgi:hypothetical protein